MYHVRGPFSLGGGLLPLTVTGSPKQFQQYTCQHTLTDECSRIQSDWDVGEQASGLIPQQTGGMPCENAGHFCWKCLGGVHEAIEVMASSPLDRPKRRIAGILVQRFDFAEANRSQQF